MAQLAIAVAVLSMMIGWGAKVYSEQAVNKSRDEAARLLGNRLGLVGDAGKTYATSFFTAIQMNQDATHNSYTVPAARVRNPTLADFVGLGFLRPEAAADVRLANQVIGIGVQYTVDTTGCTVPNCNVAFQATTTAPLLDEKTGAVDERRIQLAATTASPGNAGSSLPENPTQFVGLGGNAIGPNTTGTAGLIALRNGYDAQGMAELLRRDGTLPMTGDLNLGNHNVTLGGSADFAANITAGGEVRGSNLRATTGDVTADSGNVRGQAIIPNLLVGEGGSCAGYPNGALATNNNGSGMPVSCQGGQWRAVALGGGMTRAADNNIWVTANGAYNTMVVTTSSYFNAADGTHTSYANFNVYVNGAFLGTIQNSTAVQKGGSKGHYWGYDHTTVRQVQFNYPIPAGSQVSVQYAGGAYHRFSQIKVDLSS
ncbi:hypothetical protein BUE93_22100 [Chromobacterium amazonense]|uniref:Bacterial shufflon protein N-terminal domain-containing protein n=2 Tax=Chromobacterium amazonense TaxID=1382803 RepID=A0A2S9WYF4_9NEIS|nr:hypothetical protein BUE93_22100 [Chromobacterium amazonense]